MRLAMPLVETHRMAIMAADEDGPIFLAQGPRIGTCHSWISWGDRQCARRILALPDPFHLALDIPAGTPVPGGKSVVAARRRRRSMVVGGRHLAGRWEPCTGSFSVALSTRIRFCLSLAVPVGSRLLFFPEWMGGAGCCRRRRIVRRLLSGSRRW